jgi:anti-anti-sigma factor
VALRSNRERAPGVLHCGPLTATVERVGRNLLRVALDGELDIASAKELERRLYLPRQVAVELDLSRVSFIDIQGARLLRGICEKRGGRAAVVATSAAARRVLELSGLGRSIPEQAIRRAASVQRSLRSSGG